MKRTSSFMKNPGRGGTPAKVPRTKTQPNLLLTVGLPRPPSLLGPGVRITKRGIRLKVYTKKIGFHWSLIKENSPINAIIKLVEEIRTIFFKDTSVRHLRVKNTQLVTAQVKRSRGVKKDSKCIGRTF